MERSSKNKKILSMLGKGAKKFGKAAKDFYKPGVMAIGKGLNKLTSSNGRVGASEYSRKKWMKKHKSTVDSVNNAEAVRGTPYKKAKLNSVIKKGRKNPLKVYKVTEE